MPNWSAGLTDSDDLSQFPSAVSPLAAQGIDADEVRANPDLLQQLTGIKDQTPVNVASDGRPPEAAPQDASAKSAGATGGAGDIPSSPAPQPPQPSDQDDIAGYGKQGLGLLNKNLQAATDEAGKMSTDTPADVARLSAQQEKLETKTPLYDPQTGKMLQQYKPSTGSRIWRGVRGGLEGIAEHGIMGGLLGAIDPEKVTGTAYGAPNKQYTRAEDAREQQLGATDNELKTAMQTWKDVNDARKAKSGEYRANATLGKDLVSGAGDLQKNSIDKFKAEATADNYKTKADEATAKLQEQMQKDLQTAQTSEERIQLLTNNAQMMDQIRRMQLDFAKDKLSTMTDAKTVDGWQKEQLDSINKDYNGILSSAWNRMTAGSKQDRIAEINREADKRRSALGLGGGGAPPTPAASEPGSAQPSGKAVSLAAARQLPQYRGKSDAEITAAIKKFGHEVRP